MRLKQLDVIGFKSFAHRTVLDIPSGITAIVGPNGCGKSNVVDAIRWVLGEQSPRHLRGESMEDVVFKGNDRVAPTGMAQVSLTFENEPGGRLQPDAELDVSTVPAHLRNLSEITITRRYFRSGESEYLINKSPCRLKDITELFLGTGVGTKAYAIIEQGRVEQLINAKPEDRRLFIEEAAGTTLYRSRKLAAERKMERTRENLLRVRDVLRELERQIQYLHRLAKKAEQYRTLREEYSQLDLGLSGLQRQRLDHALSQLEVDLEHERSEEEGLGATLAALEGQRGEKTAALAAAEEDLAHHREAAVVLHAETDSLGHRIALLTRELNERTRRLDRLESESGTLRSQQSELRDAEQREEQARDEWSRLAAAERAVLERMEADLASARELATGLQFRTELLKGQVLGAATREVQLRNDWSASERRRDEARRRIERLAENWSSAAQRLAATEQTLAELGAQAAMLRDRVRAAEGEKDRRVQAVRGVAAERRECERQSTEVDATLVQIRSRHASLEAIQRNHEGYDRGVRSALRTAGAESGVLGVVADVLEIPQQYERAVAAVLGDRLQYVIVRDGSDGVDAVSMLRTEDSGRGSFIPLSPRRVDLNGHGARSLNGSTRCLIDLVDVDEPFRSIAETLLGDVVLVPDLNAGLALWRRNGVYVTMVTPDGDTIDPNGVITGGSERPDEEEIVSRRRVLTELNLQAAALEQARLLAQQELERLAATLSAEEAALGALDKDLHTHTAGLVELEKDLERLQAERPRWMDRMEVAQSETSTAQVEEANSSADLEHTAGELEASYKDREALERALSSLQEQAAAANAGVDGLGGEVTGAKMRVVEYEQRLEASTANVGRLGAQMHHAVARMEELNEECEQTRHERDDLEASIAADESLRAARAVEQVEVESRVSGARERLDAANLTIVGHDEEIKLLRSRLDEVRMRRTQLEVSQAEHRLRIEHLLQGVQERHGPAACLVVPTESGLDEASATARLDSLRDRLVRMGEVNAGAADELRELEERAQFLSAQKDDLERSLDDLDKTIQRLNRASRTRFAETFAAVNEKFQQVFPRLFRGGEARLVLTNEHNLLESGVEIVVRPPGKRLETVTLLSGGEKALVAVSLIFSLFLINPTPFCFLDEVDAPLDDANIGRFTDLVHEMSDHSQFIVITHNKRTMQAANVLYGVTMQEPGVSKVISVAMH